MIFAALPDNIFLAALIIWGPWLIINLLYGIHRYRDYFRD